MITLEMNRCFKCAARSSGSITVMLYQILNALPSKCGITGASAVTRKGCRFTAASMVENNQAESDVRAAFPSSVHARLPESSSFFQKRIRGRAKRTCRPDDLERCNVVAIVERLPQIFRDCRAG